MEDVKLVKSDESSVYTLFSELEMQLFKRFLNEEIFNTHLVEGLVVPVRVHLPQTPNYSVVLSRHQCVHASQYELFVDSDLTCNDH